MNIFVLDSPEFPRRKRGDRHPNGTHLFWTYRWAGRTADKGKKQMWVDCHDFERLQKASYEDGKRSRLLHPERSLIYDKRYRSRHLEEARKSDREAYHRMMADPKRRDKLREAWKLKSRKRFTPAYRASMRKYFRDHKRERERNDPVYRLTQRLRSAISHAMRGKKKIRGLEKYLGCSVAFFRKYLEQRFCDGMSWDNYGVFGWHIDHVLPCSSFNLSLKSEQAKCFHYTNFQPLWRGDNMAKRDKVERQQLLAI